MITVCIVVPDTGTMLEPVAAQKGEIGMKQMKRRIFAGAVCEQVVYCVPDGVRKPAEYDPEKRRKERFESEEEYSKFKAEISRRNHLRLFQANFSPTSIFSTLTFADEYELHTFPEAKVIARKLIRMLKYAYPDAVIFLYMGRGGSAGRIHYHMVSEGVPVEFIAAKWKYGAIKRFNNLREHNYYEGVDHGQDYTALANYLFNHWTEEQGGHRWIMTRNAKKPEREEPTEVHVRGGYTEKRPPIAPKGYKLVSTKVTSYGCSIFRYVVIPPKKKPPKAA